MSGPFEILEFVGSDELLNHPASVQRKSFCLRKILVVRSRMDRCVDAQMLRVNDREIKTRYTSWVLHPWNPIRIRK